MPEYERGAGEIGICQLMNDAEVVKSNSEARRLVSGNAVEWCGSKVTDPKMILNLKTGEEGILKAGKKRFVKVLVR